MTKTEYSSVTLLRSLNSIDQVQILNNSLGIYSLRDLAEYAPCRQAEMLVGFSADNNLFELSLGNYVDEGTAIQIQDGTISNINDEDISVLKSVDETVNAVFTDEFSIRTIEELASFKAFVEAKRTIHSEIDKSFYEKPSAPDELIPKVIGSTHTIARFGNYIKENAKVLEGAALEFYADPDEPREAKGLRRIFYRSNFKFHFGYLASYKQKWINVGTHLGEVLHSLALAPGESRNIAFIEWQTRQSSSRQEDTEAKEVLDSDFFQHRALNEVVHATAKEHLFGETEIDATTKTTGYGLTTGFGGGASTGGSSSASGSAEADLTSIVNFPVSAGAAGSGSGAGLVTGAGSLGGSVVHSKGTTQGTLKSETTGRRTVDAAVTQDISDSTVQNSSNIRSLMSTVVVDDEQSGSLETFTRNVTNYNHSHALTIQYYEVLQKYKTNTFCDSLTPVLYLPFKPISFDIETIKKHWPTLRRPLKKSITRAKYRKYNAIVRDFKAENGMFDASGDVKVTQLQIITNYSFSSSVRVEINDANPDVKLKIRASDLDECLAFKIQGASVYIDYELLNNLTKTASEFNGRDYFEIDENLKAFLKSRFKTELKSQMKRYLSDKGLTPKVAEVGREDNELGKGSNRDNLKQNVDDGNYRLLNGGETVDFTMNIEYLLEDIAGNEETVQQSHTDSLSFSSLHSGYDKPIFNITDHINSQLEDVSDINPVNVIKELEAHFETYKYSFTKYLLSNLEKEQLIDIIDHLAIDLSPFIVPFTSVVDPNPLGIVENLIIFKLKKVDPMFKESQIAQLVENYFEELKSYENTLVETVKRRTVFLPTSGVFAEAILGISNASEYININRFYNWQDSPIPNSAPQISAVDANHDYSDVVSDQLQPTIPVSVLNQISPQQMPGSSLNTALGAVQNGAMFNDMSKTDQFVGALSELASLANNSAQLAGTLSGQAAENALNAAVELGKEVAGMVNTAMKTNIAPAPSTPTQKGGAKNALESMKQNPDGSISPIDSAIADSTGTPVGNSSDQMNPEPPPNLASDAVAPSPTTPIVVEDKLEIKTNDITYSPSAFIVTHLKSLVPEDIFQLKDITDVLSSIEQHVQYGGHLKIEGDVKLTAGSIENKRSLKMYGRTVALKSFNPAGGVSEWHDFYIDGQITYIEQLHNSHYEVLFIAGDVSEIIATISDIIIPISLLVHALNTIASSPDTSDLPQWAVDWIDSNTFLSNVKGIIDFCNDLVDSLNNLVVLIENDLQASGLYIQVKGSNVWTFICEANNTIGTCVISSIPTTHDMQMDIIPE